MNTVRGQLSKKRGSEDEILVQDQSIKTISKIAITTRLSQMKRRKTPLLSAKKHLDIVIPKSEKTLDPIDK